MTISQILTLVGWVVTPVLSFIIGTLLTKLKKAKDNKDAERDNYLSEVKLMRETCKYFLRREIEEAYKYYTEQGWCSPTEKAEVEEVYKLYSGLGGNGRGKAMYQAIELLPNYQLKNDTDV